MGVKTRLGLGPATVAVLAVGATTPAWAGGDWWHAPRHHRPPAPAQARTPIRHVVVIFDENISFDHYFGTYPHAANTTARRSTGPGAPRR
jgi:phospholipase C